MIILSTEYYPENWLDDPYSKKTRTNELRRSLNTLAEQIELVGKKTDGVPMPTTLTDAEFLSTSEKAKVIVQWGAFVSKGFQSEHFTNGIYEHLHLHCGFIAHYNRSSFYHTYWNDHIIIRAKEDTRQVRSIPATFYRWKDFIRQFDIRGPYTDINTMMMYQLKDILEALKNDLIEEVKSLYKCSIANSRTLYLKEKTKLCEKIDELQQRLRQLAEADYTREITLEYQQLFEGFPEITIFTRQEYLLDKVYQGTSDTLI